MATGFRIETATNRKTRCSTTWRHWGFPEHAGGIRRLNELVRSDYHGIRGKIREAFGKHPGWKDGEAELRELRKQVTFAVYDEEEDLDKVTATVESLFHLLEKTFRK